MSTTTFDIRNYLHDNEKTDKGKQKAYDRFNLFMSLVADIPFRTLLTTKVSTLYPMLEKNMLKQQTSLKWKNGPLILKAGKELVKVAGNRTFADIFVLRRKEAPKIDRVVKKLQKLGVGIPCLQESNDLREQYFRKLVTARMVHVIGNMTPKDMFEKPKKDLSDLEKSVIIEAKMVGLLSSSCGGNGDPPTPGNGQCCNADGFCESGESINNCTGSHGLCSAGSDPCIGEIVTPEMH